MPQFLLELVSEEIPARMQARAAEDLKRLVCAGLAVGGLENVVDRTRAFVTPRRLALTITDLPEIRPDTREERRGPRIDASETAIAGFLKANSITLEQLEVRETPKGTFHFAIIAQKGGPMETLLKEVVESVLADFPWPKSMRWGSLRERWIRPVQRILCTFGKMVVPVRFAGVTAGDVSEGHRFLAPVTFPVRGFECYERGLREAYVILDPVERADRIRQQANALAVAHGLVVNTDEVLLAEVAGLVEWPVVLMGGIDDAFMGVPAEILITIMRTYQKYFSLCTADGNLATRFLMVSNIVTADAGKAIIAGNERVLRARFSDARFFWDQDRHRPFSARVGKLAERVFHAKLGTMAEKVARMRRLAGQLTESVPGAEPALVDRAAFLAKADLSTGMVGEFPELQGIIGYYYARHDGEVPEVCDAIAEHRLPLGPDDTCPSAPVSVCVALADKIDTLVGFWSIDEKPTGSKDPFALRRAALGVIRLIIENGLRLSLLDIFNDHYDCICKDFVDIQLEPSPGGKNSDAFPVHEQQRYVAKSLELLDFLANRLKVHLREKGVRHDLIAAVFALGDEDDLVRLLARVEALSCFLATYDGANLLVVYRRAMNIVRIEEKKNKTTYHKPIDNELLNQEEERVLEACLSLVEKDSNDAVSAERFDDAMAALSRLRAPVDAFFKCVTVNSDNSRLRENRLKLLSRVGTAMEAVANFTKIEG